MTFLCLGETEGPNYLFLFHVADLLVDKAQNLLHDLRMISRSQFWTGGLNTIVANHR